MGIALRLLELTHPTDLNTTKTMATTRSPQTTKKEQFLNGRGPILKKNLGFYIFLSFSRFFYMFLYCSVAFLGLSMVSMVFA